MRVIELDTIESDEELEIFLWRVKQLVSMGVSREKAIDAAKNKLVDLHDVEKLIRAGCKNADLAVRIVS